MKRRNRFVCRHRRHRRCRLFGRFGGRVRATVLDKNDANWGNVYIYIYYIKGVNKHEQGWQWWCLTCSGSVSTTFRPASAAYIRVHIMYIYIYYNIIVYNMVFGSFHCVFGRSAENNSHGLCCYYCGRSYTCHLQFYKTTNWGVQSEISSKGRGDWISAIVLL